MLTFNYFGDVKKTLYDENYKHSLSLMQQAGVTVLWLEIYMAGRYLAEKEEIIKAKLILENLGFEVHVITIPVGHPGNSLNPEEMMELGLPAHWHYRVNAQGEQEYFSACVDDVVIAENRKVVEFCRDAGFKKLFFDDDLRMGNHGDVIRGCFCERCLQEFANRVGTYYTREQLAQNCAQKTELSEQWIEYNCSKITKFMVETAVPGMQTGIMVMHNGGRYHGIDIPAIKKALPDCLFRVGELQFDDNAFENDAGHAYELQSMRTHLQWIDNLAVSYSETTVFPPRTLSPQNMVKKAELAIGEGIYNIFLMSGSWTMTDEYWQAFIDNQCYLRQLEK